ncbi:unnamed protein product, partial [Staurois parvus]
VLSPDQTHLHRTPHTGAECPCTVTRSDPPAPHTSYWGPLLLYCHQVRPTCTAHLILGPIVAVLSPGQTTNTAHSMGQCICNVTWS